MKKAKKVKSQISGDESALLNAAPPEGKVCISAGSRPGYIKICTIDPGTGACTANCKEVPDPEGEIWTHVFPT